MTHVTIHDTTAATLHGVDGDASVSGPGVFWCESCTIGGLEYCGTVFAVSGSAVRLARFDPQTSASFPAYLAFSFILALICARFRL